MIPLYPYMFKAFYDWLLDCEANPRIMVDASQPNVQVPQEYVTRDKILISIHPKYISELNIGPLTISFYTKFKGKREFVVIPYYAMNELICWDSGLTIPLNMWLTSIEMASHPNVIDPFGGYSSDEGPMPSDGVSIEGMGDPQTPKVSFEEVVETEPEKDKKSKTGKDKGHDHKSNRKDKPSFSLV